MGLSGSYCDGMLEPEVFGKGTGVQGPTGRKERP